MNINGSRCVSLGMATTTAPMTSALAVTTLGAYGFELAGGGMAVCEAYGLVPAAPTLGTALSSLFLHDPTGWGHLVGNLTCMVIFGAVVEREIGSWRLLALYLAAGVLGALLHVVVDPSSAIPLVGASGAIFGLMAVAGALRPRLLGFVVAFAGFEIWRAFTNDAGGASFGCHLGGLAAGAIFAAFWGSGRKNRNSVNPNGSPII